MGMSLMRVVPNSVLIEQENRTAMLNDAIADQQQPFVLGLATYIKKCYDAAKWDRELVNDRMLKSLRQRLGQYDPDMLKELEAQGGNQVYILLTQTKCRGAEAWMRDVLLSTGMVPWDMAPTPVPELDDEDTKMIMQQLRQELQQVLQQPGIELSPMDIKSARDLSLKKIKMMRVDEAKRACEGMKKKISDQLYQGNFMDSIDQFLSDLTTFPFAVMKGPIITNQPILKWVRDPQTGDFIPDVQLELAPTFTRVSPFDFYYEPGITNIQNGYTIERHELSRSDVVNMKGQPGYNDDAVSLVLHDYEMGMLNEWLDVQYNEFERRRLENRRTSLQANLSPAPVFKALEFNGSVSGRMLIEWGRTDIEDEEKEYEVNAWLIGRHVVRAVLNTDPLAEKPYRIATFNKVPGSIPGLSLPELIADTQAVCNASARAIVNNMAVASGPQVEVNVDRLPPGEKVTEVFPWKIWQMRNDPLGTTAPAVRFDQPDDNTAQLMQVFEKFSRQADEQSGIPAYTYGDTDIQGAGRTASGLSMLMGSAGKGIRQIITGIDTAVIQPALRHLYRWNMRFSPDESIKGDADVIMKGTSSLVKEQLNLRRNEFLQATANEYDAEILRPGGRAAILRETAKGLEMDVDKIIPSQQELELQDKLARAHKQAMAKAEEAKANQGGAQVELKQQQAQQQAQATQMKQQAANDAQMSKLRATYEMNNQKLMMQMQLDQQRADAEIAKADAETRADERIANAKLEAQREFDKKKLELQQETELQKAAMNAAAQIQAAKITASLQAKADKSDSGGSKEAPLVSTVSAAPLELSKEAQKGLSGIMEAMMETARELRKTKPEDMAEIKELLRKQVSEVGKPKKIKIIRDNSGRMSHLEQESK